jgi:hypothetical protein
MSNEHALGGAPEETTMNVSAAIVGLHHDRAFRQRLHHAPPRDVSFRKKDQCDR